MEGYPAGSLDCNVPFLVSSGLKAEAPELQLGGELKDQGILLKSDLPLLNSRDADVLGGYLEEIDLRGAAWTGPSREEPYRFRIKTVGRSFLLPPRRARLPESVESLESTPTLHSPFSPLSPVSVLYPDGLIDSQWIRKHQELVPSVYACFCVFGNDNRLKADINDLKRTLARSGYKTRVAVILVGDVDGSSAQLSDRVQERLEHIRRGTALDPKSIFYIPAQESAAGLKRAVDGILSALYGTAIEYYRDLGRHARKKRSRGAAPQPTIPPTAGTSRILSLPDWNFRYDFKAAVLAEFRQEMDAAIRLFEQAYEVLMGQDVLDTIPSWSPRWDEARLLSDVVSVRCLRIQLWMGHTSLAVRRWQAHRDRIGDFVDRRGRGTDNYGWQAWEARWAMVMANLIEKIKVPELAPPTLTLFLQPDKAVLGERLRPWELLHHTGYWYRIAARHLAARRRLARAMPEEDRGAPGSSSASQVARSAYAYDTYMCPAPHQEYPLAGGGVNHAQLIIDCLVAARTQFEVRGQLRTAAEISLECAREMALLGSWEEAVAALRPVWDGMFFRSEGWLKASEELCWLMRRVAAETGRAALVVATDWELMNRKFAQRPHWHYDLGKSLDGVEAESRPTISLSDDMASPLVSVSFAFRDKQGKAGQACAAQLVLESEALPRSAPLCFASLRVDFEGSLKPIIIEHEASVSSEDDGCVSVLALEERFLQEAEDELPSELRARCDLTLRPGQKRVLDMAIPLREAGDAQASSVTLSYCNEAFDLHYRVTFRESDLAMGWHITGSGRPRRPRPDTRILHVLPRPPKMEIQVEGLLEQYHTNEVVELQVELRNSEDEPASAKLDVHVFGEHAPSLQVLAGSQEHGADGGQGESGVAGIPLGNIDKGSSLSVVVRIGQADAPATHDVQLRATYHLASDVATLITQTLSLQLSIVTPFEANYDLVPRLHPDPWPSLFDHEELPDSAEAEADAGLAPARGFAQRWSLMCHYASFALEDLIVVGLDVQVMSCVGGARCHVVKGPAVPSGGTAAASRTMHEAQFDLVAQKLSVDDRRPVSVDLAFVVRWRRKGAGADGPAKTTTLPVGQYLVLGTEPRVLASVAHPSPEASPSLMHLHLTIENPSNHFLTFGLTMEPSDAFAFSGAKQTTMHLLPMSRRTARYRLLPLVRGTHLRPGLVVRDKYFQKMLRIMPTEGMTIDKDGLLVWVPGDAPADGGRDTGGQEE